MCTSVTGYLRCTSFSVTLQSEISAGSPGSRSSLHFLNWQLEKLYSTGHDKRHGRQRSASQKRERSDEWGRLGGIRADESCWALRNDWQLIMKIREASLACSAKPFSGFSFLFFIISSKVKMDTNVQYWGIWIKLWIAKKCNANLYKQPPVNWFYCTHCILLILSNCQDTLLSF